MVDFLLSLFLLREPKQFDDNGMQQQLNTIYILESKKFCTHFVPKHHFNEILRNTITYRQHMILNTKCITFKVLFFFFGTANIYSYCVSQRLYRSDRIRSDLCLNSRMPLRQFNANHLISKEKRIKWIEHCSRKNWNKEFITTIIIRWSTDVGMN